MLFKVDENLPIDISSALTEAGYESKTVAEELIPGVNDEKLAALCKKEYRILITLDTDFANIGAYPPDDYHGIIVLRVKTQGKKHLLDVFKEVLSAIRVEPLEQKLWIVEEGSIRIRGK